MYTMAKRINKHLGERIFLEKSEYGHELWKIDGTACII